ncbi:MAG: 3-isopropylmalate/(R)-2-methylmalate dehydratase small subunit [Gammaproteobacteria bacterium]|jgi:3-isopropylmalate/(R)-2-methylmalate dehydratase small subunit
MDAFTSITAAAIPIDIANCDTDQIIPARFLRYLPSDGGFDRYLFHDLRYTADGEERPEFILNQAPFRDGKIVVADINWGCGSSRESAVYALYANGIRCVIAPSFGDIHFNNCMKHGVLPVRLTREACDELRQQLHDSPGSELTVDLEDQIVRGPGNITYDFEVGAFDKHRMLNGLDEVGVTLEHMSDIEKFEAEHFGNEYRWVSRPGAS